MSKGHFYIMQSNGMGTTGPDFRGQCPYAGPMSWERAHTYTYRRKGQGYSIAAAVDVERVFPSQDLPQNIKAFDKANRE
jgi:hypothetical protein